MSSWKTWCASAACALAVVAPSVALHAQNPQTTSKATSPPPGFTTFIPICYNSVNGNVRYVKPWSVAGAADPNCTPPAPWNINGPYDGVACNIGGSFDCRNNEFYDELQTAGTAGPTGPTGPQGPQGIVRPIGPPGPHRPT